MKTHEERMHELLYDCEGIVEKSERICKLEELVQAMWDTHVRHGHRPTAYGWVAIQEQAEELGIELVYS